jgi:hypothetical protein
MHPRTITLFLVAVVLALVASLGVSSTASAQTVQPPTSSTSLSSASPQCCGLDGQIGNQGSVGIGIITSWTEPQLYDFVLAPGHWSSEIKPDVDGYYIGHCWRAREQTYDLNGGWHIPYDVGEGRHEIQYGWARVYVNPYKVC